MKETQQQTELLDSRQTLSLYLETLFRDSVADPEEPIKTQDTPAKRQDLEVMLIRFGQHKLALPVKDLKAVLDVGTAQLKKFPQQEAYIHGMIFHNGKNIPVYDLNWIFNAENKLVEPEKSDENEESGQVIILRGEHMAIACDGSEEILNLNQHDIRWNRRQGKNHWLQGIVLENMASLLDIGQIKRIFRNDLEPGTKHNVPLPA